MRSNQTEMATYTPEQLRAVSAWLRDPQQDGSEAQKMAADESLADMLDFAASRLEGMAWRPIAEAKDKPDAFLVHSIKGEIYMVGSWVEYAEIVEFSEGHDACTHYHELPLPPSRPEEGK